MVRSVYMVPGWLEPYEDLSDTAGLVLEDVDDIQGTAEVAVKHGYERIKGALKD